jgi:hypothetical protein
VFIGERERQQWSLVSNNKHQTLWQDHADYKQNGERLKSNNTPVDIKITPSYNNYWLQQAYIGSEHQ